jgi:hypothetical protein
MTIDEVVAEGCTLMDDAQFELTQSLGPDFELPRIEMTARDTELGVVASDLLALADKDMLTSLALQQRPAKSGLASLLSCLGRTNSETYAALVAFFNRVLATDFSVPLKCLPTLRFEGTRSEYNKRAASAAVRTCRLCAAEARMALITPKEAFCPLSDHKWRGNFDNDDEVEHSLAAVLDESACAVSLLNVDEETSSDAWASYDRAVASHLMDGIVTAPHTWTRLRDLAATGVQPPRDDDPFWRRWAFMRPYVLRVLDMLIQGRDVVMQSRSVALAGTLSSVVVEVEEECAPSVAHAQHVVTDAASNDTSLDDK